MRHFFLLLNIMLSANVFAGPVTKTEALKKAQQFMPAKQFREMPSRTRFKMAGKADAFYIFNAEHDGGFVIVSGDDRTVPILGYSDKGKISDDNMPDNLRGWLEGYALQIEALDEGAEPATHAGSYMPAIEPLIKTQWGQTAPYDLQCPTYTGDDGYEWHYPPGCVNTALAQVMNYHQWPKECPAIGAYTTKSNGIYRPELPATTFKWELMMNDYYPYNRGESEDAVAELMAYIGQANHTDYEETGSGTRVNLDAMSGIFGYSRCARYVFRSDYSIEEWEGMMYRELASKRPVPYAGYPDEGVGHEVVCDGYDGNGLFHINWGWSGGADGYYVLTILDGCYKNRHEAVVGFKPAGDDDREIPVFSASINIADKTYQRASGDADFEDVSMEGSSAVVYYGYFPNTTLDVEIGWALCQNGGIVSILDSSPLTIDFRNDGPYTPTHGSYKDVPHQTLSFGAGLPDGRFELRIAYKYSDDLGWLVCTGSAYAVARISGNTLSIGKPDMSRSTYIVNDVTYTGDMATGTTVNAKVNLTNDCDAVKKNVYLWLKVNDEWQLVANGYRLVEPGVTDDVDLSFTYDTAGTYEVRITADEKGEMVMGTSSVTIFDRLEVTIDNVIYRCNQGTKRAKVIGRSGGSAITIHSSIEADGTTYKVWAIADKAFYSSTVRSVTIEPGIEEIGDEAFWAAYMLEKIVIPEGVKRIGGSAFWGCNYLKEVVLPSTLEYIGNWAFANAHMLTAVTSHRAEPLAINRNVFIDTKTVDGSPGWMLFTDAQLFVNAGSKATYEIAEGWKEFTRITEGELKNVVVDGFTYSYVTSEDSAILVDGKNQVYNYGTATIPSEIIVDGKTYKVTAIADNAFYNVNMLLKIVIPEGVRRIGNEAFRACYGLAEVELPSTLEYIGSNAFEGDRDMKKIISNVKVPFEIDASVFSGGIYGPNEIYDNAKLYVPEGSATAYQNTGGWNSIKQIYEMDTKTSVIDGITYAHVTGRDYTIVVGSDAEALNGKDVSIPAWVNGYEVRSIADEAFRDVSLKSLTLPSSITSIGVRAFYNCKTLQKVFSNIAQPFDIDPSVFSYEETVEGESRQVFTDAVLYVPKGTAALYESAEGWKAFRQIIESETKTVVIDDITYEYTTGLETATLVKGNADALVGRDVTVPSSITADGITYKVTSIANEAFQKCQINSVTIEPGVETIGRSAFWNCWRLRQIIIPEGVKSIGSEAFKHCYYVDEIELPSTLESIGGMAFYNCLYTTKVTSHIENPFYIGESVFSIEKTVDGVQKTVFSEATLFVPKGTKGQYESTRYWSYFPKIVETIHGDMNHNGVIDAADVLAIIEVIAGKGDEASRAAADFNNDGTVNIADVVAAVNAMITKEQ